MRGATWRWRSGAPSRICNGLAAMGARGPLSRHKFDIADIRAAFTLACRRRGLNLDEGVKTTCLADPMGGSSSPYDMKVKRIEV